MPATLRRPTRRGFLATSAAMSAAGLLPLPFARVAAASDVLPGQPSSEGVSPMSASSRRGDPAIPRQFSRKRRSLIFAGA